MRALEPEVVDAVWQAIEALLPPQVKTHPLGCHRRRVSDRLYFQGILIRLVTGASWVDIEAILDRQVSDSQVEARPRRGPPDVACHSLQRSEGPHPGLPDVARHRDRLTDRAARRPGQAVETGTRAPLR
jgi:hypothetical protein